MYGIAFAGDHVDQPFFGSVLGQHPIQQLGVA